MGRVSVELLGELRRELGLRRAVETGTYHGDGARLLAGIFDSAITIELSEELWREAQRLQADVANLDLRQGDSAEVIGGVVDREVPTFYFLDGHWSGGPTAGEGDECPVLDEIAAMRNGHPDDCIFIDDARLFAAPPPPPHDPDQWPTLLEVIDAIRAARPDHHITMLADMVMAVPRRAKPAVDRFGQEAGKAPPPSLAGRAGLVAARARGALRALRHR